MIKLERPSRGSELHCPHCGHEMVPRAAPAVERTTVGAATFDEFWATWPSSKRKGSKSKCAALWVKHKYDRIGGAGPLIIRHVQMLKETDQWRDTNYIPAPLVYLNQQRWDGWEEGANNDAPDNLFAGAI